MNLIGYLANLLGDRSYLCFVFNITNQNRRIAGKLANRFFAGLTTNDKDDVRADFFERLRDMEGDAFLVGDTKDDNSLAC